MDGGVYDVTEFLEDVSRTNPWPCVTFTCLTYALSLSLFEQHPGGKKILLKNCGKDASEAFWTYHSEKVLKKTAAEYKIGEGGFTCRIGLPLCHSPCDCLC